MRYKLKGYARHTPGSSLGLTLFLILIIIFKNFVRIKNISEAGCIAFAITMFVLFLLFLYLGTQIHKKLKKILEKQLNDSQKAEKIAYFIDIFYTVISLAISLLCI